MKLIWITAVLLLLQNHVLSKSMSEKFPKGIQIHRKNARVGPWPTLTGEQTLLMAHRGEKILMPEHTVGSYEFASIEGADFVEPDLTLTKDGVLVCFHDLTLKTGTDVSTLDEFADKKVNFTGIIDEDGPIVNIIEDWFIKDFTLAELKRVKITQRNTGIRPQYFNDFFTIPTFDEYLNTIHQMSFKLKKPIGIIPELKHPRFHNEIFNETEHHMEEKFLSTLTEYGYPLKENDTANCKSFNDGNATIECGHLIIQSFELSCIKYLHNITTAEKMMLIDIQFPLLTFDGLKEISIYANYYSVWKELLYTGILAQIEAQELVYDKELIENMGGFIPPKSIVDEAHNLGLKVGIYTIYDSREPSNRGCITGTCDPENKEMELFYYFDMGVDGMFVENVPEAREIRMKYKYEVVEREKEEDDRTTQKSNANSMKFESSLLVMIFVPIIFCKVQKIDGIEL